MDEGERTRDHRFRYIIHASHIHDSLSFAVTTLAIAVYIHTVAHRSLLFTGWFGIQPALHLALLSPPFIRSIHAYSCC